MTTQEKLQVATEQIRKDLNIGHEPKLNDVLEWFEKMRQLPEDTFFQDVFFQTNSGKFLEIYGDSGLLAKWDLTKPYLKDQSDELIDFLYDLKNK